MKILSRGLFVVFEGIDGSGKTTLAKNLHQKLVSQHMPVILTREPGGSQLGTHVRTLLQEQKLPIHQTAEYLLFAADRAQHMQEVIKPALEQKNIVISDRFTDSSIAYQGYGRGLDPQFISMVNTWATQKVKPDITFYVKISTALAQERRAARGKSESFDQASHDFFEKLIRGYEDLYRNRGDVITLNGQDSPEALTQQTYEKILALLTRYE